MISAARSSLPRVTRRKSTTQSGSALRSFKRLISWSFLAVFVCAVGGYVALRYIAPLFFSLRDVTTLLLVGQTATPEGEPQAPALLLHIVPEANQVVAVTLPNFESPGIARHSNDYIFRRSELSFRLKTVIDEVIPVPTDELLTIVSPADVSRVVWKMSMQPSEGEENTRSELIALGLFLDRHTPVLLNETSEKTTDHAVLLRRAGTLLARSPQRCSVAVINTTGVPGLATQVSVVLEQSGIAVVRTTDGPTQEGETIFFDSQKPECAELRERIGRLLPQTSRVEDSVRVTTEHRADLVVTVGEPTQALLQKKSADN